MRVLRALWRVVAGLALLFAVVFLPSAVWADAHLPPVEPSPTATEPPPADPPPADPTATEPPPADPTATEPPPAEPTVTVTAQPEPVVPADAPGQDTGVYLDPATGNLRVDENTGVALGVGAWLAAVVGGLATAWLVLP